MNKPSLAKFQPKLKKDGLCLVNSSLVVNEKYRNGVQVFQVPANDLALQLGNLKVANMIMLGAYIELTKIFTIDDIVEVLKHKFTGEKAKLIDINRQALEVGRDAVH